MNEIQILVWLLSVFIFCCAMTGVIYLLENILKQFKKEKEDGHLDTNPNNRSARNPLKEQRW